MINFALCPLQSGYQPQLANNVLEQQLVGGFARQRRMFVNNTHTVQATVMLENKSKQQYFWAFWRLMQRNPQPFLWRLMIDDVEMTTYQCQLTPDSVQVQERTGQIYRVNFTVRCKAVPKDVQFDEAIIAAWVSGDPNIYVNLLEQLVNVDLDNALSNV